MFATNKELGKWPDSSRRIGKLRPEQKVVDSGTGERVHCSVRLCAATRAGSERFRLRDRDRRTAIVSAEVGCKAEPAVYVDGCRTVPPAETHPRARCAGNHSRTDAGI